MIKINLKSKKVRAIIFITLILILSVFGLGGLRERWAINNYKQGVELLRQGEYKEAIGKLQKSIDFWPRGWWFDDAQNKLLYCKLNSGEDIDKLLPAKKTGAEEGKVAGNITLKVMFFLVIIIPIIIVIIVKLRAKKQKKRQELITYIQNVGKKIKANIPPTCLEKSNEDISSVKDYQEYIDSCKGGEFVKLAECLIAEYYLKEQPDNTEYINKVIQTYNNLLNEYPGSIFGEEITYKLANLYFFRLNDYQQAATAYQRIIEKYPDSKWIKIAEARVNLIRDNSDYDLQPLTIYILAERHYENKKYNKALEEFTNVVSKYPESNLADDALYAIGDIYIYKFNKPDEAIKEYQQIIAKYPKSRYAPNAQYKIGECYRRNKKIIEAIASYKKFIDNYPDCDFTDYAYYYIGQCYEQEKDFNEAKRFYQKILDDYPASMWVVVATSRLEVLEGSKDNENNKDNTGTTE